MLARRILGAGACAVILALAAPVAQAAGAADLKVGGGKVKLKNGKLKGEFKLRNKGDDRAKRSKAVLSVAAEGTDYLAARYGTRALKPSAVQFLDVKVDAPDGVPGGTWPIQVCADAKGKVRESSEQNNCKTLGTADFSGGGAGSGSSVPTDPIPFQEDAAFQLNSSQGPYWVWVPSAYDESHQTPIVLFLWMHGCGGSSEGDLYTVSPGGSQSWISVSLGGRDGACWQMGPDQAKVLAAIADIKTHFNIAPKRVIVGGYSSGGDLAYRTAFYNSRAFAGVLAVNTSPFRDTESTQQQSLAAADTKFNVVHLAHLQDEVYPIAGVRAETNAMINAGFPLERIEVNGTHYDEPGAMVNGQPVPGTDADIRSYLLPRIDDGWTSP